MLRVVVFVLLLCSVEGKGKTSDKIKREECEKVELCKWDPTENCALRCMSEKCYEQIYGDISLEPGEIHREQTKLFLECFRQEEKALKANKIKP